MNLREKILYLYPLSAFSINETGSLQKQYDSIVWNDVAALPHENPVVKPTFAELESIVNELTTAEINELQCKAFFVAEHTLDARCNAVWAEAKAYRVLILAGGLRYNSVLYDTDPPSITALMQTLQTMLDPVQWISANNTVHTLQVTDVTAMCTTYNNFVNSVYVISQSIRTKIFNSNTPESVDYKTPFPPVPLEV